MASVLQGILVYSLSSFWIPETTCKEIKRLLRRFSWVGSTEKRVFLALKSWDKICKRKRFGVLGIKGKNDFNTALLAKSKWKIVSN